MQTKKQTPETAKERIPVYFYPQTIRQVEKTMELANCKSRSEFLDQAAVFYAGYVAAQNSEEFLSPTLAASLRAALNDSEGRTARLLFKLSVEMSMMMHVIAATAEIDKDTLRKLRGKCGQHQPRKAAAANPCLPTPQPVWPVS
ncbi:MAG: hypothetical protein HFG20_00985 [Anaerotruncus sp.]|nr:hypothetical protein [Anaerotruncus sp.]